MNRKVLSALIGGAMCIVVGASTASAQDKPAAQTAQTPPAATPPAEKQPPATEPPAKETWKGPFGGSWTRPWPSSPTTPIAASP